MSDLLSSLLRLRILFISLNFFNLNLFYNIILCLRLIIYNIIILLLRSIWLIRQSLRNIVIFWFLMSYILIFNIIVILFIIALRLLVFNCLLILTGLIRTLILMIRFLLIVMIFRLCVLLLF